jgi:2-phospho-L-lactate guanylyltransferase
MKRLAIIIPVKPPEDGKSRLAGELSTRDRYALNQRLLNHTLDQVADLTNTADVHVVSKSSAVLVNASQRGFASHLEPSLCDLNGAVALGAAKAQAAGATEIMVVPIDLPWLSSDRLLSVVAEVRENCDVLIITDRAEEGTNLLLWRPIETAHFHFGAGSAARHAEVAGALGLRVVTRQDCHLSFDLDTRHDLEMLLRNETTAVPFGSVSPVPAWKKWIYRRF